MKLFTVLRRRMKKKSGFTLVETLITMLILAMVMAVVAGGVPTAANAYYKVIDAANAQILFTETVMKLRGELAVATNVTPETKDGKEVLKNYTSGNSGWTYELQNSDKGIVTVRTFEDAKGHGEVELLVPGKLSGVIGSKKPMITKYDSITYDKTNGVFVIVNLRVEKDGKTLVCLTNNGDKPGELKIRNVIPEFSN